MLIATKVHSAFGPEHPGHYAEQYMSSMILWLCEPHAGSGGKSNLEQIKCWYEFGISPPNLVGGSAKRGRVRIGEPRQCLDTTVRG
jgi:hypothetical protein